MKTLIMKTCFFCAVLALTLANAETVSLKSPDGKNEIRAQVGECIELSVARNGHTLTGPNPIFLEVEGHGKLGIGARLSGVDRQSEDGRFSTRLYKKSSVSTKCNRARISFEGGWSIELVARDDGVAYRFVSAFDSRIRIKSEAAPLVFASGEQAVYAAPNTGAGAGDPLQNSWEGVYRRQGVKDAPIDAAKGIWYAPLTFLTPEAAMTVTESDLLDYPGWNFVRSASDARRLESVFAACPDKTAFCESDKAGYVDKPLRYQRVLSRKDFLAETEGSRTFPWRVFVLADTVAGLAESDIVHALATPSKIGSADWVRAGKASWDWWNCWNLSEVEFRCGWNTATLKAYVDFAAENGLEYVVFDAGWTMPKYDIFSINPDVDLQYLLDYAKSRNVGIILWTAWAQLIGREEQVVSRYAKMGAKGFKIDFIDRDDQDALKFIEKVAAVCARHEMVIDFHGMFKPTGIQRTYPNIMNFEGVHGLECPKSGQANYMPNLDCTLAFTRMVAGPMDYTPGAMRNGLKDDWHHSRKMPSTPGTRVHQMALIALFDAPLQMLCDSPTQYRKNPECLDFIAKIPTVWDDTKCLVGEPEKCAVFARRKGKTWYLTGISGWNDRSLEIDTSFLGSGDWTVDAFSDGVNADRDATDWRRTVTCIRAGDAISVRMAPGGGYVARLTPRSDVISASTFDRSKFHIGVHRYTEHLFDDQHVRELVECGVDFVVLSREEWKNKPFLDLLQKWGVQAMVSGPVPRWGPWIKNHGGGWEKAVSLDRYEKFIDEAIEHPAICGINILDEISALDMRHAGRIVERVRERYPNKLLYFDMNPASARLATNDTYAARAASTLGTLTYEEYLETYCRELPVDYFSYDRFVYGWIERPRAVPLYYDNQRMVANACRKTGRSFWFAPQVNSWKPDKPRSNWSPKWTSENQLRFQAYSAMAFGCEELAWSCWDTIDAWFTNQVIDAEGHQTQQYAKLKRVNWEIRAIEPHFMRFRNVDTHFVGFDGTNWLKNTGCVSVKEISTGYFRNVRADDGSPLVIGEMVARKGDDRGRALFIFAADDPYDEAPKTKRVRFRTAQRAHLRAYGTRGAIAIEGDSEERTVPVKSNGFVMLVLE